MATLVSTFSSGQPLPPAQLLSLMTAIILFVIRASMYQLCLRPGYHWSLSSLSWLFWAEKCHQLCWELPTCCAMLLFCVALSHSMLSQMVLYCLTSVSSCDLAFMVIWLSVNIPECIRYLPVSLFHEFSGVWARQQFSNWIPIFERKKCFD